MVMILMGVCRIGEISMDSLVKVGVSVFVI